MFPVTRNLPKELTSYDLLKTLATGLMVADHLGAYFFIDETWWRVLGRLCVPIWFFLIGYAKTRDIPRTFWIGTGVLALSAFVLGQPLFPLSVLFSFALARLSIDWMAARALRTPETLAGMFFILMFMSLHSAIFFEYGTLGFLLALFGYVCRHKEMWVMPRAHRFFLVSGVFFVFFLHEVLVLPAVPLVQLAVLFTGGLLVFVLLSFFKPAEYPGFTKYGGVLLPVFKFFGRWSLEFYLVHLVGLRIVSALLWPETFSFFQFRLISPDIQAFFFQ